MTLRYTPPSGGGGGGGITPPSADDQLYASTGVGTASWTDTIDILKVDNITIDAATIVSDTGAISFDDEDLSTSGKVTGSNVPSPTVDDQVLISTAADVAAWSTAGNDQVLASNGSGEVAWENQSFGFNMAAPASSGQVYVASGVGTASWTTFIADPGGTGNVALGSGVLSGVSGGSYNTGIGDLALDACVSSWDNVAIGDGALQTMTGSGGGGGNTAIGSLAMNATTTGYDSVGIGFYALQYNVGGYYNVAVGLSTLGANVSGNNNVAIGTSALTASEADKNVAVGANALSNLTTSAGNNTAIGYNSGLGITTGSSNTIIGANVTGLSSTLIDHVIIADGNGSIRIWIDEQGDVDLRGKLYQRNPTTGGGTLKRNYNNSIGTSTSANTFDIAVSIPAGSRIIGCQLRVDSVLASSDGGTTWSAAYIDGSTETIATGLAFAQLTKKDTMYDSYLASDVIPTQADIRITCDGGKTFLAGGKVRAVVWYEAFTLMGNIL